MGMEIERRFLVTDSQWLSLLDTKKTVRIQQGYLSLDPERVVRVRKVVAVGKGTKGFITVKGKKVGRSAPEFEYEIPDPDILLETMCLATVDKVRHTVDFGGLRWEVDEFKGRLSGLVIAEIELTDEKQVIELPSRVGKEITEDHRYSNLKLGQDGIPKG